MTRGVDVAVVGGGPVGMLLAYELALHGVGVTVVERLPAPTGESKAGTLHARTAQVLHRRGLLAAVAPDSAGHDGGPGPVRFHFGGMFELDLARVVDEGPVIVGSPQAWAEQVFANRALKRGVRIERDSEVIGLADRGDGVELSIRSGDGAVRRLTAAWVVGCDGARSAVRSLSEINFVGTPASVSALMGEVRLLDPATAPGGWQRNPQGWTLFWINPFSRSRVSTYDFRGPHPDRSAPVTLDELRGEVERIAGRPVPMDAPRWLSRYSDAALQADRYRHGRVLLAGDAAHVHFPAGGQGLNLGIQDALNLGWKLAATINGWAPPGLLDTYHRERHPIAARVLYNVRAQVALMDPDPRMDALRELFAELMGLDQVNDFLSGMITGSSVRYDVGRPGDRIAGRLVPDVVVKTADRTTSVAQLLHTGRPVLIDLADRADLRGIARNWQSRVDIVAAAAGDDIGTDAVLVRPDGYAAWSAGGDPPDSSGLRAALETWFGTPS